VLRVVAATGSVGASQLSSPASGLRKTWRLSNARAAGASHECPRRGAGASQLSRLAGGAGLVGS